MKPTRNRPTKLTKKAKPAKPIRERPAKLAREKYIRETNKKIKSTRDKQTSEINKRQTN